MDDFRNKRVTVAGLGRFGGQIAVARWLCEQGAKVLVTDKDPAEKLADSVKQLAGLPIEFCLGEHRTKDFVQTDLIVTSPAIPPINPHLAAAREARVPITTEIRLFIERCPCKVVGVTGTKGKSTTTAMLGRMLEKKYTTWVGGNIGKSLLPDLAKMKPTDLAVLELSSYMLEHLRLVHWSPHVAVVTIVVPDHLEWHGSFDHYVDAKKNVVRFQKSGDIAVVCEENELSRSFAKETKAKVVLFGVNGRTPLQLRIAGRHNQLNAQGALAAAMALGVLRNDAQAAIDDFQGLPHRLEIVHESNGVKYVNDSIATIPDAAVAAAGAYTSGKIVQIIGGSDKQLDMRAMCESLSSRCKALLTIGQTGPALAKIARCCTSPGPRAIVDECGDLTTAVKRAREIAVEGDVVLLSPGCASQDQFRNFEERGTTFTKLVKENPL